MDQLSRAQARRVALRAQGFGDPRPTGRIDRRHLRKTMNRLQLLQLDSVPVIIRTQYLPLYARLGPYDTALLDRTAYHHDEWFEAWAHEASLLPVETEPLLRWAKRRAESGDTWGGLVRFAHDEPDYIDAVYREVAERGPMLASELTDPRPRAGDWWAGRSMGRLALDWLFRIGRVGIRRVGNFEKQWDLTERIIPDAVQAVPTPSEDEALRELLVRSADAHGIGTAEDLIDYFRLPVKAARPRLAELIEDGRLVECAVEGQAKTYLRHPEATLPRWIRARALLSPFDPVVWHRPRAEALFDFEYRIEIYVPKDKRRYGYYVLPFLLGDRLVGRVDLKTDRNERVLRVLAAYAEPGTDPGEVGSELRGELDALAQLVGAESVDVAGCGGDLASHL